MKILPVLGLVIGYVAMAALLIVTLIAPPPTPEPVNLIFNLTESNFTIYQEGNAMTWPIHLMAAAIILIFVAPRLKKSSLISLIVGAESGLLIGLLANFLGNASRVNNDVLLDSYAIVFMPLTALLAICWGTYNALYYFSGEKYWNKTACFAAGLLVTGSFIVSWHSGLGIALITAWPATTLFLLISAIIFLPSLLIKKLFLP